MDRGSFSWFAFFAHIFTTTAARLLKLYMHINKACIQACAKDQCIRSTFCHQKYLLSLISPQLHFPEACESHSWPWQLQG